MSDFETHPIGTANRIEELEAKMERAAAVLRLCLKYNTAMHSGASEHNKKIKAVLEELERKS